MAGIQSEDVIAVLQRIDVERRQVVKEVTLDLSDPMRRIARTAFPQTSRVIDRSHIQELACDAMRELRVKYRWDAIRQANEKMGEAERNDEGHIPYRYPDGDTRKELLIRLRHLPSNSVDKWTEGQEQGAAILFGEYPDIKGHVVRAIPCG